MPHVFDCQSFATLAHELRRVLDGAQDQERRLSGLVSMLDGVDNPTAESSTDEPVTASRTNERTTIPELHHRGGLLSPLRELCIHARQQREIAEALAISLVGESVGREGAASDRRHVLVVDDSQDSRELAALALEASGIDVATAANGLEGVIFAHYAQPIVILMDITMPVLDGFAAARLLKASPTTRESHVVAYTAQPSFCHGPLRHFFVDVVAKPAPPDLLVRKVQRILAGTPPVEE